MKRLSCIILCIALCFAACTAPAGADVISGDQVLEEGLYVELSTAETAEDESLQENLLLKTRNVLYTRLEAQDYEGYEVYTKGNNICMEIPGIHDLDRIRDLISDGKVEFIDSNGQVVMTGDMIESATYIYADGDHQVAFSLNEKGTSLFAEITSANLGRKIGIYLDGKLLTEPTVQNPILNGSGVINGIESKEQATAIAGKLKTGPIPLQLKIIKYADVVSLESQTDTAAEESASSSVMTEEDKSQSETSAEETDSIFSPVMTYAEYAAAELETPVTIEAYVQDHQSWWDNKVTVYLQDADGAYFAYEMVCSEEDAAKLVPGTKIRVTGYKTEWAGEVEIASGCTFEFVEGAEPWIAEATDVTGILATDELISHMNQFVTVKGAKIAAQADGAAFAYKNTEEKTDDLYFAVDVDGQIYNFCVEFYLRGKDSDVYKAVEGLKVGDVVDLEGFLYWYNGPNLQATGLTVREP